MDRKIEAARDMMATRETFCGNLPKATQRLRQ
jgi:hypothetical protein